MNRFKLQGYLKEFPCLREIVGKHEKSLTGIKIARLDSTVLKSTPSAYHWDGSMVGISKVENVHFVLRDGTILQDDVRQDYESGSNYAHSERYTSDGESVLEAIDRLGIVDSLQFAVWTRKGFHVVEHHSQPDWELTIYKEGKGLKLAAAIEAARAAALEEVRAEANF